jgi:hypothetical protein
MAYNLPSVFYVYVTECGEYYLYNASRRKELKIECHGLYYTTILNNMFNFIYHYDLYIYILYLFYFNH